MKARCGESSMFVYWDVSAVVWATSFSPAHISPRLFVVSTVLVLVPELSLTRRNISSIFLTQWLRWVFGCHRSAWPCSASLESVWSTTCMRESSLTAWLHSGETVVTSSYIVKRHRGITSAVCRCKLLYLRTTCHFPVSDASWAYS